MPDPVPVLILIGGAPGSGKTSLARRLATDSSLPLWTKDFVKETLSDGLGVRGLEASKALGRPSFAVFYAVLAELLRGRVSLIAEANYRRGISEIELRPLVATARTVQIFCDAPRETCVQRVVQRFDRGERHPIHADRERLVEIAGPQGNETGSDDGWSAYQPLDLEVPTLVVDTSEAYRPEYSDIVAFINKF